MSDGSLPAPAVAYRRWLDSLGRAGWSARPGAPGTRGDDERVPLDEALGRVSAAAVTARWPSPRCDCAAMDGIAVRAADLAADAAETAPSAAAVDAAGRRAGGQDTGAVRLPAGAFEWIDTGDPMPAGLDSVVVRERLLPQADGGVLIAAGADGAAPVASAGQHVRTAGEDFAAGEELLPAGRLLRPGDLAAAAAGGHATFTVARRPTVAIIPTGDEIRPVGEPLRHGDIIDTNSVMLAARCRQLGALPEVGAIVPDDPDALAGELRRAAGADLVLVIAGSSRGRGDHVAAVLAQVGGVAAAGVAVRPGHPAILGHVKRPAAARAADGTGIAPVIGLPGYPLAAAVIFELFAVPLLGALTGHAPARTTIRARLDRDWTARPEADSWVLVTLGDAADGGGLPLATPASRGAGTISQFARADAWWPVPAGRDAFAAGTEIAVLPVAGSPL